MGFRLDEGLAGGSVPSGIAPFATYAAAPVLQEPGNEDPARGASAAGR